MKTLIFTILLLACVACQARSVEDVKSLVKDNRALMADIDKAKENMNMVANSAGMMSSQEMMSAYDLNEWGVQYQLYQLYKKLLSFEVSEAEIETFRNQSDSTVINISTEFVNAVQEPRNTRAAANLAWYHLDIFNFDTLSEHISTLEKSGAEIWAGVVDLENLMKTFQKDIESNVIALTSGLNEMQQNEIKNMLNFLEVWVDGNITNLRMTRIQFADASNNAVAALQLVLSQVPQQ